MSVVIFLSVFDNFFGTDMIGLVREKSHTGKVKIYFKDTPKGPGNYWVKGERNACY